MQPFVVRAYRASDRARVRAICAETAWAGEPGAEKIPSAFFWSELMTRYFTDREPEHASIIERAEDGAVFGYLLGASDVARLEIDRLRALPWLGIRAALGGTFLRRTPRRLLGSMVRALVKGELLVPARVRERFPATFALAVAREARGRGLGAILMDRYLAEMRKLMRPGVHVQTISVNEPVLRIIQRSGFQLAAEWPLTAFAGAGTVGERLSLLTWVLPL